MFDTFVTVTGNVATKPEARQVDSGGLVVTFRVASSSRRYDKNSDRWVPGDELFIKVNCWNQLGRNVCQSVGVGDPVVIRGRLYSRRFTDQSGMGRYGYEISATGIGHDLARGTAQFVRHRPRPRPDDRSVPRGDASAEFDSIVSAATTDASATPSSDGDRDREAVPA